MFPLFIIKILKSHTSLSNFHPAMNIVLGFAAMIYPLPRLSQVSQPAAAHLFSSHYSDAPGEASPGVGGPEPSLALSGLAPLIPMMETATSLLAGNLQWEE